MSTRRIRQWTLIFFLLAGLLAGCGARVERPWLRAPGWSRGLSVGNTLIGDPAPLAVDDHGNVYFLLIGGDEDRQLRVVALDPNGASLWDRTYPHALTLPDQPEMIWDGHALQLFWIDREELFWSTLESTGDVLRDPARISGDRKVGHFDVDANQTGALSVWFSGPRRTPGLYAFPEGDPGGTPILVDAQGIRPDVEYDRQGKLHSLWVRYPQGYGSLRFYYYFNAMDSPAVQDAETLITFPLAPSSQMRGPWIGIDDELAYMFWSIHVVTGMEAGTVLSSYLTFTPGQGDETSGERTVAVPGVYELPYQEVQGAVLDAGQRVVIGAQDLPMTGRVLEMAVNPRPSSELAIAAPVKVDFLRRKQEVQISALYLRQGILQEYQLLSFTPANSTAPSLISDEKGNLFLTWLEKGDLPGSTVYFATTSPTFLQNLDRFTVQDFFNVTIESLFGIASGLVLIPLGLVWVVLPIILMAFTSRFRKEDEPLTAPGTFISLVLALAIYWAGKMALLPQIGKFAPFSAWIPRFPASLHAPFRIGFPVIFTLLGLVVAWSTTYRHEQRSPFLFLFIYAAVDGLLSLSVYGVLVLGGV